MKIIKRGIRTICYLLLIFASGCDDYTKPQLTPEQIKSMEDFLNKWENRQSDITIATYNILNNKKKYYPDCRKWRNRRDGTIDLINMINPLIIGLQEVEPKQRRDLKNNLNNYNFYSDQGINVYNANSGVGEVWNDIFNEGEALPILVKEQDLIEVIQSGHNIINTDHPRLLTWIKLKYIDTGREFFVYNTHLNARHPDRRIQSANEIVNFILENSGDHASVLLGDLNTRPDEEPLELIKCGLSMWDYISRSNCNCDDDNCSDDDGRNTVTGQGESSPCDIQSPDTRRLDYVLGTSFSLFESNREQFDPKMSEIVKRRVMDEDEQRYLPSDHFPVWARLILF